MAKDVSPVGTARSAIAQKTPPDSTDTSKSKSSSDVAIVTPSRGFDPRIPAPRWNYVKESDGSVTIELKIP